MDDILISIIVPAYNIESYIGRCIESITNQVHKKIEIIIVNDGSTDRTGEIIEQYAMRDQRIIPIYKENGGVSSARLTGIRRALGEYIGFVDGDDYIEPNMYSTLLSNALKYEAEISHCGYQMVFPNRVDYYHNTGRIVQQNRLKGLRDLLEGTYVEPGICNKLYHRSLMKSVLEKEKVPLHIKNNEDILMNYWFFKASEKSIYEDFCPYHYMIRKGSAATTKLNEHKLKDPIKVMRMITEDLVGMPEAFEVAEKRLITQYIGISIMPITGEKELIKPFRKEVRKELKKNLCSILSKPYISKTIKLRAVWALIWPASYRWIHNVYTKVTGLDKKYEIE